MNWTTIALVIGSIGWIGPLIVFFAYFRLDKRKKRAEARLIEQEGDLKSLEYFTKTIEKLVEDNEELKKKVGALEKDVEAIKQGKTAVERELELYKQAAKKIQECKGNNCPAHKEFKRLKLIQ